MKKLTLALTIILLMGASCTLLKNKTNMSIAPIDKPIPITPISDQEMIEKICVGDDRNMIGNISRCDNYYMIEPRERVVNMGNTYYDRTENTIATCGNAMNFDSEEAKQKNSELCAQINPQNCKIIKETCFAPTPKNDPITFTGEMATFTEEIFGFSFEYPQEQIIAKQSINGGGQSIGIKLSVNKYPYNNVIEFETISRDSSIYYQEKKVDLLENGNYQISHQADSVELSASKVIHNDLGEIAIFNGIGFTDDGLNTGKGLGYMAVMAIGDDYYLPINIFAEKDLISYDDFVVLLETIQKIDFTSENCPMPEIKSWGKGTFLRLCDRDTPFPAILFEELEIILFASHGGLEIIELGQPFDRELLAKDLKFMTNCNAFPNLISCELQADGPGSITQILTINPTNKTYLFADYSTFGGKKDIKFSSSHSDNNFDAHLEAQCPPDLGGFGCNYGDALSLDIKINSQNYDEIDYTSNVANIKTLFTDCHGFDFKAISAGWEGRNIDNIDVENFPPQKLYCYNDDVDAHFDLIKNEFVVK